MVNIIQHGRFILIVYLALMLATLIVDWHQRRKARRKQDAEETNGNT